MAKDKDAKQSKLPLKVEIEESELEALKAERAQLKRAHELSQEAEKYDAVFLTKKAAADASKKEAEAAHERLMKYLNDPLPLFDKKPATAVAAGSTVDLRTIKLDTILQKGGKPYETGLKHLRAKNIENLHQLAEWLRHSPLAKIPGIGPETAAVIGDILTPYYVSHPDVARAFEAVQFGQAPAPAKPCKACKACAAILADKTTDPGKIVCHVAGCKHFTPKPTEHATLDKTPLKDIIVDQPKALAAMKKGGLETSGDLRKHLETTGGTLKVEGLDVFTANGIVIEYNYWLAPNKDPAPAKKDKAKKDKSLTGGLEPKK